MAVKMEMLVAFFMLLSSVAAGAAEASGVTYDGRSLIINGTRRILFSGSIHYPRSTPDMWPNLISKAKQGGLDVIQTYVFWNLHERIQGQYDFEGRNDLVGFIKQVRDQGLYVSLRIGPFIESEWGYGGLPYWLRGIPGIIFRSDNEPFKIQMQKFVTYIVNMMKSERLYASQGGPIILSQIENEYEMVEAAFHEKGPPYVVWAASMAVALQTGVPWMMCKQQDAPDPVINACNGLNCGETFPGPNTPNKPALWTENWTSQYQAFGDEQWKRPAEDIAFAVALFIAKNGSFINYYMYHGGTNFGRSASSYVTTSYYDDAPLDEFGLISQPKWGHLKELHAAIKALSWPLLAGAHTSFTLGTLQQAYVYRSHDACAAFLVNTDPHLDVPVQFSDNSYELPRRSISILSDCKNVSFNTAKVSSQHGVRSSRTVQHFDNTHVWREFREGIPSIDRLPFKTNKLLEQMATTKDETDYLWYTVSYEHTSTNEQHLLHVASNAHVIHAFVNGVFVGSAHGSHKQPGAQLEQQVSLRMGQNAISLLSVMVGLPDSGAYLERRVAGLHSVSISNDKTGQTDLSNHQWGYQVGLTGENSKIYTPGASAKFPWTTINGSLNQPLVWYQATFDAPPGNDPMALNLASMGKGEAWINGQSIGRYWVSFKTPKGQPSQYLYHVPRYFLKPSGNHLVLLEEIGGNPLDVTINTMSGSQVCGKASDSNSTYIKSRQTRPGLHLRCHEGRRISAIEFASYGSPLGDCDSYSIGSCHSLSSKFVTEMACIGKRRCVVPLSAARFGGDPCPGSSKSLMVVAKCS